MRNKLQAALFYDTVFSSDVSDHVVMQQQSELKQKIEQEEANLEVLKAEVVEVLRGSSAFGSVLLNDLIQMSENKLLLLKAELVKVKEAACQHKARWHGLLRLRQEVSSKHIRNLDALPIFVQQEIAYAMISRVELGRGRAINIEWTFGGITYLGSEAGT